MKLARPRSTRAIAPRISARPGIAAPCVRAARVSTALVTSCGHELERSERALARAHGSTMAEVGEAQLCAANREGCSANRTLCGIAHGQYSHVSAKYPDELHEYFLAYEAATRRTSTLQVHHTCDHA